MYRFEYQSLKLWILIFHAPQGAQFYSFFSHKTKIAAPLKDIHIYCDISVPEILNPRTILCVYTGSQEYHSGLASAHIAAGGNSHPIYIAIPCFYCCKS
jgi:hypothetical protein